MKSLETKKARENSRAASTHCDTGGTEPPIAGGRTSSRSDRRHAEPASGSGICSAPRRQERERRGASRSGSPRGQGRGVASAVGSTGTAGRTGAGRRRRGAAAGASAPSSRAVTRRFVVMARPSRTALTAPFGRCKRSLKMWAGSCRGRAGGPRAGSRSRGPGRPSPSRAARRGWCGGRRRRRCRSADRRPRLRGWRGRARSRGRGPVERS